MAANLTARENQILIAVVKVATIDSKGIDWVKVAAEAEFNTAKQARDKFAAVRNKLFAMAGTGVPAAATGGTTKAGTKRKKGMRDSEDADDAIDDFESLPKSKKPKTTKATKSGGGKATKTKGPANLTSEASGISEDADDDQKAVIKPEPMEDGDEGEGEGEEGGADEAEDEEGEDDDYV